MSDKKQRVEISSDIAAEILFQSDRTCCVCRQRERPVQLHHIDDDPSNSAGDNLAVLCFDCHRETQIRGGFDRKLDAAQVKLYKADWIKRVETRRNAAQGPAQTGPIHGNQVLRYLQIRERSEEHSYDFEADYALVGSPDSTVDSETNLCINAFVIQHLQRFRADAIARTAEKNEMKKTAFAATAWDSLAMSHSVALFTPEVLSLEFQLASYYSGAAHPNTQTRTLNFRLHPSFELNLRDIFKESSNYLDVLSRYCITDLSKQKAQRWYDPKQQTEQMEDQQDNWILSGAGPEYRNFECFSLMKNGMVIHFDPYSVGSHAEGKYEVFIPAYELKSIVQEETIDLLSWTHM
jgi:Protein of unknown function (DUF3298)